MNRKHDWLREAKEELDTARELLGLGRHAWTCFTAQQSAEKSLKAIALHLARRATTHDMVELLKELAPHVALPPPVMQAASVLNRYFVNTRDPDAFVEGIPAEKFTASDATAAVDLAQLILGFAADTLGWPESP